MKYLVYFFFLSILSACSSLDPTIEINTENADQVTSFENTPESIVMYFYASRIRKDDKWKEVCIGAEHRSPKFERGLEEYDSWTFSKYRFVSKEEFAKDEWWVKVYMEISFEGDVEDGEDEVTVSKINGTYLITEVPT